MESKNNKKSLLKQLEELDKKHKKLSGNREDKKSNGRLKVYYGWTKINKIRKREAISVIFENQEGAGDHNRSGKILPKMQETVYVRFQTEAESEDAKAYNRMFTEYSIFLDDKAINGDLEKALQANDDADKNNVAQDIRDKIKVALRQHYQITHRT